MIRFVTVPHTGTRWMEKVLKLYGVEHVFEHIRPGRELELPRSLPTLTLVRDPMLHVISKLNQGDEVEVDSYRRLAGLVEDGAHGFRIDVDGNYRDWEVEQLEEFFRRAGVEYNENVRVDWTPEQPTADRTGLKARYELGLGPMPEVLKDWADEINHWPEVLEMLDTFGYELEWMA